MSLGDAAFEASSLRVARTHYEQVLRLTKRGAGNDAGEQHGSGNLRPYALYKLAWVAFNEAAFEEAFNDFKTVVATSQKDGVLRREALKDLVRTYGAFGAATNAAETFETVDAARATWMLERLARQYFDEGKVSESITVLDVIARRADADGRTHCDRSSTRMNARMMLASPRSELVTDARQMSARCSAETDRLTTDLARTWRREVRRTLDVDAERATDALCALRSEMRWTAIDACEESRRVDSR